MTNGCRDRHGDDRRDVKALADGLPLSFSEGDVKKIELQGGEVRTASTGVERADASGVLRETVRNGDRLARQRRTLERALLEPESDLAVVGPLLELEHLVGRADLPTSGKEITSVIDAGERVRSLRRRQQRGGTLERRLGPIRDERPAR